MEKKIADAFALIAKTTNRKDLLAIATNAEAQGFESVVSEARTKFDLLVAEDAGDPIVPAWDSMIKTSEKFLGHRTPVA
jgi:hypothetical protein